MFGVTQVRLTFDKDGYNKENEEARQQIRPRALCQAKEIILFMQTINKKKDKRNEQEHNEFFENKERSYKRRVLHNREDSNLVCFASR